MSEPGPIRCPYCGHTNLASSVKCEKCGTTLKAVSAGDLPLFGSGLTGPLVPAPYAQNAPAETRSPVAPPLPPSYSAPAKEPPGRAPSETAGSSTAPAPILNPRFVLVGSGKSIPLPADRAELTIGRADEASGVYPDVDLTPLGATSNGVSRLHARLRLEGHSYRLEDLRSTNGTFIDQFPIEPEAPQPLQPGAEVRFGRLRVIFQVQ